MGGAGLALWLFLQITTPPGVRLQDEGTLQGQAVTLNCTGAGISCAVAAGVGTLNASGGGGGGNSVEQSLAVVADQPNPAVTTVIGQAWVSATSVIVCNVLGTTADGLTPEAINVAKLGITIENRVAGVGFDIRVENWYGLEGTIRVHCLGV